MYTYIQKIEQKMPIQIDDIVNKTYEIAVKMNGQLINEEIKNNFRNNIQQLLDYINTADGKKFLNNGYDVLNPDKASLLLEKITKPIFDIIEDKNRYTAPHPRNHKLFKNVDFSEKVNYFSKEQEAILQAYKDEQQKIRNNITILKNEVLTELLPILFQRNGSEPINYAFISRAAEKANNALYAPLANIPSIERGSDGNCALLSIFHAICDQNISISEECLDYKTRFNKIINMQGYSNTNKEMVNLMQEFRETLGTNISNHYKTILNNANSESSVPTVLLMDEISPELLQVNNGIENTEQRYNNFEEYIQAIKNRAFFMRGVEIKHLSNMLGIDIAIINKHNNKVTLLKLDGGNMNTAVVVINHIGNVHYQQIKVVPGYNRAIFYSCANPMNPVSDKIRDDIFQTEYNKNLRERNWEQKKQDLQDVINQADKIQGELIFLNNESRVINVKKTTLDETDPTYDLQLQLFELLEKIEKLRAELINIEDAAVKAGSIADNSYHKNLHLNNDNQRKNQPVPQKSLLDTDPESLWSQFTKLITRAINFIISIFYKEPDLDTLTKEYTELVKKDDDEIYQGLEAESDDLIEALRLKDVNEAEARDSSEALTLKSVNEATLAKVKTKINIEEKEHPPLKGIFYYLPHKRTKLEVLQDIKTCIEKKYKI